MKIVYTIDTHHTLDDADVPVNCGFRRAREIIATPDVPLNLFKKMLRPGTRLPSRVAQLRQPPAHRSRC